MARDTTQKMNWRDFAERQLWTFVASAGASLAGVSLLGVEAWQGAALVGLTAVVQSVTVVGRTRLAVLPNPGRGFGGEGA